MKVLVTGGTGFVGQYLVNELVNRDFKCRVLVRSNSKTLCFSGLNKNIEFWKGDITIPDTLKGIAQDIQYVYHLAAEGHVSAISKDAFRHFKKVNVEGTINLVKECGKFNIKKFVHFSSTAAMGLIKKEIVDELDIPQPTTPYQKSKLASEIEALQVGKNLGVPVVVVRPCMIYGINGRGEFFKICQLMRKGFFPRVGRGENLTPLVHVKDIVQGAIKAAETGTPGEVYLLASETSINLNELRESVIEAWGEKALYPYVPVRVMFFVAGCFEIIAKLTGKAPVATRQNIASTVWDRVFSIEKAKRELGYTPSIHFREGILETVNWFKNNNPR